MIVALIPARGGSKRLPRKNILPFAGRPLICHSIELARSLAEIDRVMVSTDDADIAQIAAAAGAEVVTRPPELATDHATTASAVRHALLTLGDASRDVEAVVTLQPNCPLRPASVVTDAIALFRRERPDSVVAVTESRHKIGRLEQGFFIPAYRTGMRSQDMSPGYFENGVVYVSRGDMVLDAEDVFGARILPLVTDPLYALGDIDTALDFQIAELLFNAYPERFAHRAATREGAR